MAIRVPIRIDRVHKGWRYEIDEGSNTDLHIIIRPPYLLSFPDDNAKDRDRKVSEYRRLSNVMQTHTYTFTVRKRYLGFFMGVIPPWNKAEQEAIEYIDKNLGVFDFEKIFRSK